MDGLNFEVNLRTGSSLRERVCADGRGRLTEAVEGEINPACALRSFAAQ